jgi:hypothetical protein
MLSSPKGDPLARAFDAYFASGDIAEPSRAVRVDSDGRQYVLLSDACGVLAVYLIEHNRLVTRLEDVPDGLAAASV